MANILVDAVYKENGIQLIFYNEEERKLKNITMIDGHKPYLLTDKLVGIEDENHNVVSVSKIEKEDLLKEKRLQLFKVETKTPLDVERIRNNYENPHEDKIPYVYCYIYDNGLVPGTPYKVKVGVRKTREEYRKFWEKILLYPVPDVDMVAMDIETEEVGDSFPNAEQADGRILCAVFYSKEKVIIRLLRTLEDSYEHKIQYMKVLSAQHQFSGETEVKCFDSEVELIKDIFSIFELYPFLVTYNGSSFDLKYIYYRAIKLGIPKEEIPIKIDRKGKARTTNTCHLDIYFMFYHHEQVFSKLGRYEDTRLDSVAMALLGEGQVKTGKLMIKSSYLERTERCLQDAKLTYNLATFNNRMVIRLIFMIARITRMTLPDACVSPYSLLVKGLFDSEHRINNFLIPNGNDIGEKNKKFVKLIPRGSSGVYAGATVLNPEAGIYFDVSVLDFPSMYPTIISENNLSYETVCCEHDDCKNNIIEGTKLWVCRKNKGFLSILLGSLRDFRVELKSKEKDATGEEKAFLLAAHNAIKLILNASYGVFGSEEQELYLLPLAAATTSIGRNYLHKSELAAKKVGMKIIFGDTDSLLVVKPTDEQLRRFNDLMLKETGMTLDIGKRFRYVIMSSRKKNYLGVDYQGNMDIKGLTGKKRHVCKFIKQVFNQVCEVLKGVSSESEFEKAKVQIKNLIKLSVNKLYTEEYKLEDLVFNYTLGKKFNDASKNSQIYRAVSLLACEPNRGTTIGIVLVKGKKYSAVPLSLATKQMVNIQAYIDRLRSTMEQILEPMELDFDEIIGKKAVSLVKFQRNGG